MDYNTFINDLLDKTKKELGLEKDTELAKHLKVTREYISILRHGKRLASDYLLMELCNVTGVSKIEALRQMLIAKPFGQECKQLIADVFEMVKPRT